MEFAHYSNRASQKEPNDWKSWYTWQVLFNIETLLLFCFKLSMVFIIKTVFQKKHYKNLSENFNFWMTCFQSCIKCLSQSNFISPMMNAMNRRRDLVGVACEALHSAFHNCAEDLMRQVSTVTAFKSSVWYIFSYRSISLGTINTMMSALL